MKRLKTFLTYVLLIIGLWILVDILTFMAIHSTYKNKESRIYVSTPEITVSKNRATYINGVISGNIYNNTNEIINEKYLKIDFYSSNNIVLGTKYITIKNLAPNTNSNFEMWYRFTGVNYATLTVVDNVENITEEQLISQKTARYMIFGTLIALYFT